MAAKWSISKDGVITAEEVNAKKVNATESLEVGSEGAATGITIYDTITKQPYCMQMVNGSLQSVPGKCGTTPAPSTPTQPTQTSTTTPTDTNPPPPPQEDPKEEPKDEPVDEPTPVPTEEPAEESEPTPPPAQEPTVEITDAPASTPTGGSTE
jgi:outer membrane biosynthesis protein TonB